MRRPKFRVFFLITHCFPAPARPSFAAGSYLRIGRTGALFNGFLRQKHSPVPFLWFPMTSFLRVLYLTSALCALASSEAVARAQTSQVFAPYPLDPSESSETVTVTVDGTGPRSFALTTTARQRENGPTARQITEHPGALSVSSANTLFDALFAQAMDEVQLDSVSTIRDDAYNDGHPIPCDCFQTGEKWNYVWTRDLSYSTDLALAFVDTDRAVNSLKFKTSQFRPGVTVPSNVPAASLQIVQDTGSGGSWPVSTDRVTWALGAEAVLNNLEGAKRQAFAAYAYAALRGTIEADRVAIFDANDGLYTGEQSFLDWRDQTYAPYVLKDLTQLAQSKALSTNVVYYRTLRLASRLAAEQAAPALARKYDAWAQDLKAAINKAFWLPDRGLYASLTTPDAHAAPVAKFDFLGEALAITSGVASPAQAESILAKYPHAPFGVPVYYPQQPDIAVYHNRAIWPFVTGYELEAAAKTGNAAAANNGFDSLYRAAALHLTNTENLEWLTGRSQFDDGPVINSSRQLWSVAGYVSAVARTLFGFQPEADGLTIRPFLTAHMRQRLGGTEATLSHLSYMGHTVSIRLHLPPQASEGSYPVKDVRLNGKRITGPVSVAMLGPDTVFDVTFGAAVKSAGTITVVPTVSPLSHDDPRVFSPETPMATVIAGNGHPVVSFNAKAAAPVVYQVWRNGAQVAQVTGVNVWTDPKPPAPDVRTCYRVVAVYPTSQNTSHPSATACLGQAATQSVSPAQSLHVPTPGRYALTLTYDNHQFNINTGVTNAVKRLEILDRSGVTVAQGIVQMPHIDSENGAHPTRNSTELRIRLTPGIYTVRISDYFNMSDLQANASYSRVGGASGPVNAADVTALNLTKLP